VELTIVVVLAGATALGCLEFYRAKLRLRNARQELMASRGRLGAVIDELGRQLTRAEQGRREASAIAASTGFDTLVVFLPGKADRIDTVRFFVNRFDRPPSLVRQSNRATPTVFAERIDSAHFVPVGDPPYAQWSIVLVGTEPDPAHPGHRFRLGETLAIAGH
jgi:hypothetical protein